MHYTLRKATYTDSNIAYQIKKSTLKAYVEKIWGWTESFQQAHHSQHFSPVSVMMIEVDGNPIGLMRKEEREDCIFLDDLYLLPAFQGQGIGTSLIRQMQDESRLSHKPLVLEVLRINRRAIAFYQRNGFKKVKKIPNKWVMQYNKCRMKA